MEQLQAIINTNKNQLSGNPSQPYYHATDKEIEVFEHANKNKIPLLLKGPTGTGKSRFVEYMAHQLNKELITISCHEETSSTDLIGEKPLLFSINSSSVSCFINTSCFTSFGVAACSH